MKVLEPTALPAFAKVQICSIACGEDHVLALTTTGTVYTWGNGVNFQLGRKIMERRKANGLRPKLAMNLSDTGRKEGWYHI